MDVKRRRRNPRKFDRCVRDVKRSGTAADPFAVCAASLRRKPRRSNPPTFAQYLVAARRGAIELYYDGVKKFVGARSRARKYLSKSDAEGVAYLIREGYAERLKGYSVSVVHA